MKTFNKISIVGAGYVGAATARAIAIQGLSQQLSLIDIKAGLAKGQALDISHSLACYPVSCKVNGSDNYADLLSSDLVIITAGIPRKPGMTRTDLLCTNASIIKEILDNTYIYSPNAVVVIVTNPVDILVTMACVETKFNSNQVIGLGGLLDSIRMSHYASNYLPQSSHEIAAMVIGGHADTMIPLPRFTKVGGQVLSELLPESQLCKIVNQTKIAGAEVLKERGFSAHEAPAAAISRMLSAMLDTHSAPLPCVCWQNGEYNIENVALSVPAKLNSNGLAKIDVLPLNHQEQTSLYQSAETIRQSYLNLQPGNSRLTANQ